MTRISITLPKALQQELMFFAEDQNKSVSEVLRDAAERLINSEKSLKLKKAYDALFSLDSTFVGEENLSSQIDEILYGDAGAWRGTAEGDSDGKES